MSLYISSTTASSGLSDSPVNQAISQLAMAVALAKREERIPGGPSLDVTFMLPGQFDKPDFTGMRMGGYTREANTLFFEITVPDHIVHSNRAKDYVPIAMQDVVTHAGMFFQENNIAFDDAKWQELIDRLEKKDFSLSGSNNYH